jgi:hypothetical protein
MWNQARSEIQAEMNTEAVSEKAKATLKKTLEETDPWTLDPKINRRLEKILGKETSKVARDWENKLRAVTFHITEVNNQVAAELIPEISRWENLKWRIQCKFGR